MIIIKSRVECDNFYYNVVSNHNNYVGSQEQENFNKSISFLLVVRKL